MITGSLAQEEAEMLVKFLKDEVRREDLPVPNVDFCHRTPMTVLPIGAMAEIDCDKNIFLYWKAVRCKFSEKTASAVYRRSEIIGGI